MHSYVICYYFLIKLILFIYNETQFFPHVLQSILLSVQRQYQSTYYSTDLLPNHRSSHIQVYTRNSHLFLLTTTFRKQRLNSCQGEDRAKLPWDFRELSHFLRNEAQERMPCSSSGIVLIPLTCLELTEPRANREPQLPSTTAIPKAALEPPAHQYSWAPTICTPT